MSHQSAITTHVLDTAIGRPAAGVPVSLDRWSDGDGWRTITQMTTDADGRIAAFGPAELPAGRYKVTFDTFSYFDSRGQSAFYPEVSVVFMLDDPATHYHVPLVLSPFAYSTYRGS